MNPEQANDLMQRYAASKPGLGRSQLAERIVDEVMPKLVEACEAVVYECNRVFIDPADMSDEWVRIYADLKSALALARKP